jgi:peptide/nickel transport system ATP-binding protein
MTMTENTVYAAKNLEKYFTDKKGLKNWLLREDPTPIRAVDGVDIEVKENQTIGVIGESGCGKTTLLRVLMGLYEPTDGEITLHGERISEYSRKEKKEFHQEVQIIFQDPFDSLNPKLTIKQTLMEPLKVHGIGNKEERVRDILERVELRPPESFLSKRPRQLSGGELQRVSIARALILEPSIILADEPVSMLDVSTQAAILTLLENLIDDSNTAMVYISHDLSTVSYVCDEIMVMYLGRIVEQAKTMELLQDPKHPYTQALIQAIPVPDPEHHRERTTIEGSPREPKGIGEGCRFRDRCPEKMPICEKTPRFVDDSEEGANPHKVSCHLYYDHEAETSDNKPEITEDA